MGIGALRVGPNVLGMGISMLFVIEDTWVMGISVAC